MFDNTISFQKIFAPGGGGGGADGHVHGALDRVHVGGEEVVLLLFLLPFFILIFHFHLQAVPGQGLPLSLQVPRMLVRSRVQ